MVTLRARALALLSVATVLVGCLGCESDPARGGEDEIPQAVLATFRVEGQDFKIWVTRGQTIVELYQVLASRSTKTIPRGPILLGPGEGDHNLPWSWHLSPTATIMTDQVDETCDGTPAQVEESLEAWLAIGVFCPSNTELISVQVGSPS
jgi:hypothetical protein